MFTVKLMKCYTNKIEINKHTEIRKTIDIVLKISLVLFIKSPKILACCYDCKYKIWHV